MKVSSALLMAPLFVGWSSGEPIDHLKHPRHRRALAYAVQGRKSKMDEFLELQRDLSSYIYDVDFFILTYDDPLEEAQCTHVPATAEKRGIRTHCLYAPQTTWTEGRNLLARQIGLVERKQEHEFKYWVMLDEDVIIPVCGLDRECRKDCCFDRLNRLLLSPAVNYATVGCKSAPMKEPHLFDIDIVHYADCVDARMHAMHRDAVPILLPYIDYIDSFSWWESQALLFHVISYCLPGASAMYPHFQSANFVHAEYPRGRFFSLEKASLESALSAYPGSGLLDVPFRKVMPGDCANVHKYYENVSSAFLHPSTHNGEEAPHTVFGGRWQKSERYQQCLPAFHQRFKDHLTGSMEKKAFVREEGAVSQYAYSFAVSETDVDVEAEAGKNNRTTTGAVTSSAVAAVAASAGESLLLRNGDIVRLATSEGSTAENKLQQQQEQKQEPVETYSEIYVILGGQKHLVPDKATFEAMGISIDKLKFLSRAEFESVPTGSALLKEPLFPVKGS